METGSSIISYKGDANLGLGSDAAIPVTSADSLNIVNETGKNLMLMNHQNNILKFQQKIEDRDNTLKLLAAGQIASGVIDEKDRPYYQAQQKKTNDAFHKMIQAGGINNPDAYREYVQEVGELQNVATQAQSNWIELSKLNKEKGEQKLKSKIDAYDSHIKKQKGKGIYAAIDPYQHSLDFDFENGIKNPGMKGATVGGGVSPSSTTQKVVTKDPNGKTITTTTAVPATKGKTPTGIGAIEVDKVTGLPYNVNRSYIDFDIIKNNQLQNYQDPELSEQQRLNLQGFGKLDIPSKKQWATRTIAQLEKYNTQRGFAPGDKGYIDVNQIKSQLPNANNNFQISMLPHEFAAIATLAAEDNYISEQRTFDKDLASAMVDKQKANADTLYKRALGAAAGTKARAYANNLASQIKLRNTKLEKQQFVDDLYQRNFLGQNNVTIKTNGGLYSRIDANNSTPIYYPKGKGVGLLKPIGGTPVYDPKDLKADGTPKAGALPKEYTGGHYDINYVTPGGKGVNLTDITKNFSLWVKQWSGLPADQKTEPFKDLDDYIKFNVENGLLDFKIKGDNATIDRGLFQTAQMQLSDEVTTKGEEDIWGVESQPTEDTPQQ